MCPYDTWHMMDEPSEDTWPREREEKEGGNFLKSSQKKFGGGRIREKEIEKEENEKKKKKKKEKQRGKIRKEEGECVIRERKKKELHFPLQSSANRRLKHVRARDKVGPREESYVWVLETAGFVAFLKVGVSPTLVISCLVAM